MCTAPMKNAKVDFLTLTVNYKGAADLRTAIGCEMCTMHTNLAILDSTLGYLEAGRVITSIIKL